MIFQSSSCLVVDKIPYVGEFVCWLFEQSKEISSLFEILFLLVFFFVVWKVIRSFLW